MPSPRYSGACHTNMGRGAAYQEVLHLSVLRGPATGQTASKQSSKFVLGRRKNLGFTVPDPAVSEKHAEIVWTGSFYLFRDLGSSNGSHHNGKPVQAGQPCLSGLHQC